METRRHENVNCEDIDTCYESITIESKSWKPFLRQMLVSSAMWTCFFIYGMFLGTPTVLVPYERKQANSSEAISKEMASWLSAIFGYVSIPWVIALPIIVKIYGRRKPYIFINLNTIVGVIVFLTSQTIVQVLISEILQGVLVAANVTLSFLVLTEYTSPEYRGLFLTIKSASFFWGVWIANAIGTFLHWKYIGIIALMCTVYNIVTVFFWCESPYWLARKGRFEECTLAYYWLNGTTQESQEELISMIKEQRTRINKWKPGHEFTTEYAISAFKTLFSKEIYKPLFLSLVVIALYYVSGKIVCSIYAIDIFKKISGENSAYKGMLILDGVTVFAMYVGSGLSKILKRRTLLFGATSLGILLLFVLSLYLYLIKLEIILDNIYVSLTLLSGYSLAICCGPMILSTTISAELIPLKARSISVCLSAIGMKIMMSTLIRFSPYLFDWGGMHGTFLFYGIGSSVCLFILYLYLPETKDKTIQQIMDTINGNKSKKIKEAEELLTIDGLTSVQLKK